MEGDVETIRALLKGETGKGCRTPEALLLSEEEEKLTLVLFTILCKIFVFCAGTVEGWEGEGSLVLLMSVKCVWEVMTVLLILGGKIVDSGRWGWDLVLDLSACNGGGSLGELNVFVGLLGKNKVLSLLSEYVGDGFSTATAFVSSFPAPASLVLPPAPPSTLTLTVLLSAPTALLAVHS